jgi:catechol 2,3-dioxygenase-like lactoylglutathione lyase family enzyme
MIAGINHVTLAVKNVEISFQFYKEVLKFQPLCKRDKGAYFLVGNFWFCLNLDESRVPNPCYTHYAFSLSNEDFETMSQRIIDSGAQIFKENSSPGKSLYFLDPDSHKLEIHVGDWQSRVEIKKANLGKWANVEWFI